MGIVSKDKREWRIWSRWKNCNQWVFLVIQWQNGWKRLCISSIMLLCDQTLRFNETSEGETPIPYNTIWTDNFLTQYKCCQNFLKVATIASNHTSNPNVHPIANHIFAPKCRFKGSWDPTAKSWKKEFSIMN